VRIDWAAVKVLTFDCYGTLIDWEEGILEALRPVLHVHGISSTEREILELYALLERRAEEGQYRDYKSVLGLVMEGLAETLGFQPDAAERHCLATSLARWMPFPDSVDALAALRNRFALAVISNIDDDLFSFTHQRLGVRFDWVITAEQVRSYKPSLNNFRFALERIGTRQVVHVAQSLHHDIAPANQLGISSVWVNRRQGRPGSGATPPAQAVPDIVIPDLRSLVSLVGLQA